MRLRTAILAATFLLPAPLLAQVTTYTYTGNDFNQFTAYTPPQLFNSSDSVNGDLVLSSPLSASLTTLTTVAPTSFSFSDGLETITNLTTSLSIFQFETNAAGAITGWNIFIGVPNSGGSGQDSIISQDYSGSAEDEGQYAFSILNYYCGAGPPCHLFNGLIGGNGSTGSTAGMWIPSSSASATPEPSSFLLLFIALPALAAASRRHPLKPLSR